MRFRRQRFLPMSDAGDGRYTEMNQNSITQNQLSVISRLLRSIHLEKVSHLSSEKSGSRINGIPSTMPENIELIGLFLTNFLPSRNLSPVLRQSRWEMKTQNLRLERDTAKIAISSIHPSIANIATMGNSSRAQKILLTQATSTNLKCSTNASTVRNVSAVTTRQTPKIAVIVTS